MIGLLRGIFTPSENSLICIRDSMTGKARPAHWFPWLMLVWTFWIFATPLLYGNVFPHWMPATFISFALFLVMFHRVYYRDRTQVVWNAIGIAILGFVVTPVNPGAQGYLIYACAFLAFQGTSREAARNMIIVLVLYSIEWQWLDFGWITLASAILVGFAVGFMNINFARKHERDAQLMLSHDEIRRLAAVAERERIGRDLHDLLGHTLSLITLKSELANRIFERDPAAARREIADVESVARDALAQVRRAVTGIRAAGIAAELASARLLLESNGVRLTYDLADVALPADVETVLAMTVREAVTNIQRHARASTARVSLRIQHKQLQLEIVDNGRGGDIVPGNGLVGMRERLATIDATVRVDSRRGEGTTLLVTLTVPECHEAMAAAPTFRPA
ncbi:MAG TPA: sensor histidine kinase [Rudaea sp.]|jgi:two-component system sensor histidine kinase DesK|nr:sensor histidine kinase [Rudaea sp.]